MTSRSHTKRPAKQRLSAALLPLVLAVGASTPTDQTWAQQALESGEVEPMGVWVDYLEVHFEGKPILVHLRTGYERAIILPEPVRISESSHGLPGSEILVDHELVGFYPTQNFKAQTIRLIGLNSGTIFELTVSSSPQGTRKPMQIFR